jgi:molecular chaperone Hsp33
MSDTPAFLDSGRPPVPDLVIPRGALPFFLPHRPVRGRLVRLGPLADALLTRHGSFSVQAKGDGPVSMLLADCTDAGELRGHAITNQDKLQTLLARNPSPSAEALLGKGYLAFTMDPGGEQDRHQGIVAIEGESLADMALHYFDTSEQLRCQVHLTCQHTQAGWRAGALILEKVAGAGGTGLDMAIGDLTDAERDESWRTATMLAATLTDRELLDDDLPAETLLYRLFHTEGVVTDLARALSFGCRCSRARLAGILEGFPPEDLDHMAIEADIVMTCEFCNYEFRFPRQEVHGQVSPGAQTESKPDQSVPD